MNWDTLFTLHSETVLARFEQRRAEVLKDLYLRLSPAGQMLSEAIDAIQMGGQKDCLHRLQEAGDHVNDFIAYFERHRISLTEPLCQHVDDSLRELKKTWSDFTVFPEDTPATDSEWYEAWARFCEDVPSILEEIAGQFRRTVQPTP
jgi:hypothetical protein